jgi:Tfp pilus assembly protein PilF
VSQLFDSLRREGTVRPRTNAARTAHGDTVLATLGYSRIKQRRASPAAIAAAVLIASLAAVTVGWNIYVRPATATSSASRSRTSSPRPRPTSATTRSATPSQPPVAQMPSLLTRAAGPPVADVRRAAAIGQGVPTGAALQPPVTPSSARPEPLSSPPQALDAPPAAPTPAASDLELALYFHRAGDFDNALHHYRALLQRNELNAQAHNNLGLLYQEKDLLQESARELQRAVLIEPRNTGARNNYGVTLLKQGKVDEATAEFRVVLGSAPRNLDALVNLAIALRAAGKFDVAKETLVKALTIAPRNAAAHYNLGQLYDQTDEPARAVEHYRTFLDAAGAEHAARASAVRARIAVLSRTPE